MTKILDNVFPFVSKKADKKINTLLQQEYTDVVAKNYETLSANIPGFVKRDVQQDIINHCTTAINDKEVLVAQAGTGIGKTLSYLTAAIPYIGKNNAKLIISTNTIALQTQLIEKDLPLVLKHLAPELSFEMAKGSGRYLCLKRAEKVIAGANEVNDDLYYANSGVEEASSKDIDAVSILLNQYNDKRFNGDLDTLSEDNSSIKKLINRDSNQCPGKKVCQYASTCAFYIQREKIAKADIIVTNHALLSQTVVRNQSLFTGMDSHLSDHVLVVDEAHRFPNVLRDVNEASFSLSNAYKWLNAPEKISKYVNNMLHTVKSVDESAALNALLKTFQKLKAESEQAKVAVTELNTFLKANFKTMRGKVSAFDNVSEWVLPPSTMDASFVLLLKNSTEILTSIRKAIKSLWQKHENTLLENYNNKSQKDQDAISKLMIGLKNFEDSLNSSLYCLTAFNNFADLKSDRAQVDSGIARWITKNDKSDARGNINEVEFTLNSNLIHVKEPFQALFVEQFRSIVLTSATLENLGSTDYFTEKLGIEKNSPKQKVKLFTSPFNYTNVKLNMPINYGNPNHSEHDFVVLKQLTQLMARHKAILVLFTSNRALNNTYEKCPEYIKNQILCQHQHSKSRLISKHKSNIDEGKTSILFGVDGLSEGVDLAGDYLTCVVITKLPFENLAKPLFKYEGMCIEKNGLSSFMTLSLPMCSQKLTQGVGRLIRTEKDFGEIVILDSRVNTKPYGYQLIENLPMYNKEARNSRVFHSTNPFIKPNALVNANPFVSNG